MARKGKSKRAGGVRWARRLAGAAAAVGSRFSARTWLALLCAALLASGMLFARHLTREAYAWEVFRVDAFRGIEVDRPNDAPKSWLDDLSRAAHRIQARGPISIFDEADLLVVREEVGKVPWILRVDEIERRFPDRLYVRLSAREPIARVIFEERMEWVDEHGVLLPPPGSTDEDAVHRLARLPAIYARASGPVELPRLRTKPPTLLYGASVPDRAFRAACATAARLAELGLPARLPQWRLSWIDTTGFDPGRGQNATAQPIGASEVVLVFAPANARAEDAQAAPILLRVDWGAPPAHEGYEPPRGRDFLTSLELRLQHLENWARANPDCNRSYDVTVRFGNAVGRTPEAKDVR